MIMAAACGLRVNNNNNNNNNNNGCNNNNNNSIISGGGGDDHQSPTTMTSASNSTSGSNNEGKMVRKRTASEMEVQQQQLYSGSSDYYRSRLPRRNNPINQAPTATPSAIPNYSTMSSFNDNVNMSTLTLPPSSLINNVTSGASGFLSTATSAATRTTTNFSCIDNLSPHNNHQQPQPPPPAVCGFSGLPLFPPADHHQRNRNAASIGLIPAAPSCTSANNLASSMEDSSATAWIDGIIKDLIHNSANVSIPQLIHNVREIIFPCNPNLAALLEYRLRSLNSEPLLERSRNKDAALPLHMLQRANYYINNNNTPQQQQQQQQGSSGLTLNLDNVSNYSLQDSSFLNWPGLTPLPPHIHEHHPSAVTASLALTQVQPQPNPSPSP
ncbi:hypothetical protein CISIN_1g048291mg [Citrus sinensis]|uniref:Uncharacterized protein n=1 Tax=Citrus sinensis TaxID=2711 RepID=A0A067FA42_CITSI|nr:hypothetical protein CISIN_1g048291mg [Citrus sinensis]